MHYRQIVFLDSTMDNKTISNNYKTNICFLANDKNIKIFLSYKEFYKDKITDLSILGDISKLFK